MENNKLSLEFHDFISEDEIELGRQLLCFVTSWEEPPYFIVMTRTVYGMRMDFDSSEIENTRIIKWAYLPDSEYDDEYLKYLNV